MLNGVTEPQHLTAAKGTEFTKPMRRLRTDMASVRTEGTDGTSPDNDAVLLALGVHLGLAEKGDETSELGEPGEYAPADNAGGEFGGAAGHLVEFSSVQLIETEFPPLLRSWQATETDRRARSELDLFGGRRHQVRNAAAQGGIGSGP
ncbi:hypothetical protein ABZV67_14185 [Streptomyces sp. NPDC005065]|uniref:hypothetical protein n=2 Tax=Streptomyces TaxID=1883 RepID=UPI00339FB32E